MNGDSNTTAIIIVLAVLGLALVGAILLIRFIVRRILAIFLWFSSRRNKGRRHEGAHQRSRGNSRGKRRKEPTLTVEALGRENQASYVQTPDSPQVSHSYLAPRTESIAEKGGAAKPRSARGAPEWIAKNDSARVAGRNIGGMVYVGRGPRGGGNPDNAFIDSSKNVRRRGGDFDGQGLHYWPNYSTIEAQARATYLDWLSSGRSDTRYNIGYVFLYFYGLERRVFVDKADEQERSDIVSEVRRLLEIYGDNHSIRRYLGAFIDATNLLDSRDEPRPVFEHDGYEVPSNVLLSVGRMAARGEPLTGEWLLSWYLCHPETRLRTPDQACLCRI